MFILCTVTPNHADQSPFIIREVPSNPGEPHSSFASKHCTNLNLQGKNVGRTNLQLHHKNDTSEVRTHAPEEIRS